jgi:predicted RNA-binding Zn ribbon-like protein
VYAAAGEAHDGLADTAGLRAWLAAVADRLPPVRWGSRPPLEDVQILRAAVRELLHSAARGQAVPNEALATINRFASLAPSWDSLEMAGRDWDLKRHYATAEAGDLLLAVMAASAISLLGSPERARLRECGAPGCVLMFLKDHPRREWCSGACGNRARQARHYQRRRQSR